MGRRHLALTPTTKYASPTQNWIRASFAAGPVESKQGEWTAACLSGTRLCSTEQRGKTKRWSDFQETGERRGGELLLNKWKVCIIYQPGRSLTLIERIEGKKNTRRLLTKK